MCGRPDWSSDFLMKDLGPWVRTRERRATATTEDTDEEFTFGDLKIFEKGRPPLPLRVMLTLSTLPFPHLV